MSDSAHEIRLDAPLSEAGRQTIRNLVARANDSIQSARSRLHQNSWPARGVAELLSEEDERYILHRVADPGATVENLFLPGDRNLSLLLGPDGELRGERFCGLDVVQLLRLMMIWGELTPDALTWVGRVTLARYRSNCPLEFDLLDLARAFRRLGLDEALVADALIPAFGPGLKGWSEEDVSRFFLAHPEYLSRCLGGRPAIRSVGPSHDLDRAQTAYELIQSAPELLRALVDTVWEQALGSAKSVRPLAQQALSREPDRMERILSALASKKAPVRTVAAEWLGVVDEPSAVDPIREALAKERNAAAREAMMSALERLGAPVESFLDHEQIEREAAEAVSKKAFPDSLAWLPFDQLPRLRWRRDQSPVSAETAAWWLLQAHRLKKPDAGPLLRRQIALTEGAAEFGTAVLKAWIDFDVMPCSIEQAREKARAKLEEFAKWSRNHPELESDPDLSLDFETMVERLLKQPVGSAIASKGVLAVPAAGGGDEAVDLAVKYIRSWYGWRLAQCKALVRMLGWIDTPSSIQFLVATSKNFRTRGIRLEAAKVVDEIAERRGWTPDELADRMIPDGDLDSDGRLVLDYGSRKFVAELTPGRTLLLRDEQGKERRQLPKPAVKDDPEAAAESRRRLSASRKQIKSVVKEQTQRLFVAMCLGRRWTVALWREALLGHPVMRELGSELVWRLEGAGQAPVTVRPSGGALLSCRGAVVSPDGFEEVLLCHDVNTPPEIGIPWLDHFAERAVQPLFGQFARGLPELSDEQLDAKSIDDFEGYLISGYALRNACKKLGYLRGPALDAGVFLSFQKPFPELGLEIHIGFTGNELPEQDHPTALQRLSFRTADGDPWSVDAVPLTQVPRILLLESYRDLRQIAESGDGFDPDWKSRIWNSVG